MFAQKMEFDCSTRRKHWSSSRGESSKQTDSPPFYFYSLFKNFPFFCFIPLSHCAVVPLSEFAGECRLVLQFSLRRNRSLMVCASSIISSAASKIIFNRNDYTEKYMEIHGNTFQSYKAIVRAFPLRARNVRRFFFENLCF